MVYSNFSKMRALHLWKKGHKAPTIASALKKEGFKVSRRGIHKFLRRFQEHGTIGRLVLQL